MSFTTMQHFMQQLFSSIASHLDWEIMDSVVMNATRCTASTFPTPTLLGAEFLSIEANLVTNYSFDVPKGWTYSQPALDVRNATFCNVTVTYTHSGQNDTLHVEAWLPTTEHYNGRLQAIGGGGWAAGRFVLGYAGMANAIANGFATVTTDAGHPDVPNFLDWLLVSPGNIDVNALHNFGQISLQDEASIAKSLIASYYGQGPSYSYWNSCSQGGRQGLKLAQQYPSAYDGIIAAAPGINWARFLIGTFWPLFYMESTKQFPRECELDALTSLAVLLCDKNDGVEDGLISDPEACRETFDPFAQVGKSFLCPSTNSELLISKAAAAVANATWNGPRFSNGKFMYFGYEIGADLSTLAPTICNATACSGGGLSGLVSLYQAFVDSSLPADTSFTHENFDALHRASVLLFASNMATDEIDLRPFRDGGGKLITYHGLSDPSIPPAGTLQYYEDVSKFAGDISSFYKYYRVPGLGHCWGGNGGQPEALFGQLQAWVENGTAPESSSVVVTRADNTTEQQVICPYPKKATFGSGCHTNSTQSWFCS
ncbi:putative feruloyl esterase [Paramyrothecium foliicola]|nr:putative feruloyl esterase [Paramyrothecium foliicola]